MHVVRMDSSAIKFDRVEIALISLSIIVSNHEPTNEGRKLECP